MKLRRDEQSLLGRSATVVITEEGRLARGPFLPAREFEWPSVLKGAKLEAAAKAPEASSKAVRLCPLPAVRFVSPAVWNGRRALGELEAKRATRRLESAGYEGAWLPAPARRGPKQR